MEYIRTLTREFATGERLVLEVDSRSGNVVVEGQDTDRATVQVVAHIHEETAEGADEVLARIAEGIHHQGEMLTIVTPRVSPAGFGFFFGRGTRVDYAITVPRLTECRISNRSGRVEVARVIGPVQVDHRSGRLLLQDIGTDVTIAGRSGSVEVEGVGGRLIAAVHSGRISVRDVKADVRVSSHSGAIQVEQAGGSVEATANSGSIHCERIGGDVKAISQSGRVHAAEVGGSARIDARSGAITLAELQGSARLRTASGAITFRGAVRGDLEVQAASGSVRLEVDPDYPFFIDAESAAGSIRSDLPPRTGGPGREDAPKVHIRTGSGNIRLSRYAGF